MASIAPRKRFKKEPPSTNSGLIRTLPCRVNGGDDAALVSLGFLIGKKERDASWRQVVIPPSWSYNRTYHDQIWVIKDEFNRPRIEVSIGADDPLKDHSSALILSPFQCIMKMIWDQGSPIFDDWLVQEAVVSEAHDMISFVKSNHVANPDRDLIISICQKILDLYGEKEKVPPVKLFFKSSKANSKKIDISIRSAELRDRLEDIGCRVEMPSRITAMSSVTLPEEWRYLSTTNESIPFAIVDEKRRVRVKFILAGDDQTDVHVVSALEYVIDTMKKGREPVWDYKWAVPSIVRQEAENALNYPHHASMADRELASLYARFLKSFGG